MPSIRELSLEYEWPQEGDQHILHLGEHALLQIDPDRDVWVLRSLLKAPGLTPLRFAVRTVEIGKSKAEGWTMERQHIIAHACGQDDLVPLLRTEFRACPMPRSWLTGRHAEHDASLVQ